MHVRFPNKTKKEKKTPNEFQNFNKTHYIIFMHIPFYRYHTNVIKIMTAHRQQHTPKTSFLFTFIFLLLYRI